MDWQLAIVIFAAAALLATAIGRARLSTRIRPLADAFLIAVAVFLGVYAALTLSAMNQRQVEKEQVIALLGAAKKDAEAYRRYLSYNPSGIGDKESAQHLAAYFRSHPRVQPFIIERMLAEDVVVRHISTVSYYDLTALLRNIQEAQAKINSGVTSGDDGQNLVNMNLKDIELVSKILSWENLYQQGRLSVDKLKEFSDALFAN